MTYKERVISEIKKRIKELEASLQKFNEEDFTSSVAASNMNMLRGYADALRIIELIPEDTSTCSVSDKDIREIIDKSFDSGYEECRRSMKNNKKA